MQSNVEKGLLSEIEKALLLKHKLLQVCLAVSYLVMSTFQWSSFNQWCLLKTWIDADLQEIDTKPNFFVVVLNCLMMLVRSSLLTSP